MTDEDSTVAPRSVAPDSHYGETLLYDLAKFYTTLSILAVGGVLTVTATADPRDVKPVIVAVILAAIALAGTFSVSVAHAIADARISGRDPKPGLALTMRAATALLGMGTGGFLMTWWDSLS
jgi:hypothetical protein